MKKVIILLLCFYSLYAFAGQADTILVHSTAMNKDIKCVVIRPDHLGAKLSVIYLLHGYSGEGQKL